MRLNQQQLKFSGTGASWKKFPKAPIRSGFFLIHMQPHKAWKHQAMELTEDLVFYSATSWSYSVSVAQLQFLERYRNK